MTIFKCKFCGTENRKDGTPFQKQGQLNLHEYHCKMKQSQHVSRETPQEKEKECEHEFRLLSVSAPIEKRAYLAGYKEVCVKCQQLR